MHPLRGVLQRQSWARDRRLAATVCGLAAVLAGPPVLVYADGDVNLPVGPIAAKDRRECDALQRSWDALTRQRSQQFSQRHTACLNANSGTDIPGAGNCSKAPCLPYHGGWPPRDIARYRDAQIKKCRAEVEAYARQVSQEKARREAETRRAADDQRRQEAEARAQQLRQAELARQREAQRQAAQQVAADTLRRHQEAARQLAEQQRQWLEAQRQAQAEAQRQFEARRQEMQRQQMARQQATNQLQESMRVAAEQRRAEAEQHGRLRAESSVRQAIESWQPPRGYQEQSAWTDARTAGVAQGSSALVDPFANKAPATVTGLDELFATVGAFTPATSAIPFAMLENVFRAELQLLNDIDALVGNFESATPDMADAALTTFGQRAFGPAVFFKVFGEYYISLAAKAGLEKGRETAVAFVNDSFYGRRTRPLTLRVGDVSMPTPVSQWAWRPAGAPNSGGTRAATEPQHTIYFGPVGLDQRTVVDRMHEHWLMQMLLDEVDERSIRQLLQQIDRALAARESER